MLLQLGGTDGRFVCKEARSNDWHQKFLLSDKTLQEGSIVLF